MRIQLLESESDSEAREVVLELDLRSVLRDYPAHTLVIRSGIDCKR